jgi:regulator of nonsense transcripts 1
LAKFYSFSFLYILGTGKTDLLAAIVYNVRKIVDEKILICAPSNTAVDQLAMKLKAANVEFLIFKARIREGTDFDLEEFTLHKIAESKWKAGEVLGSGKKPLKSIAQNLLNSAKVVLCTCTAAGDDRFEKLEFSTVIIDEAANCTEPTSMIPIQLGVKRLVLAGDHKQLPPLVLNQAAAKSGLSTSLMERLIQRGISAFRLCVQYRMHPELAKFPFQYFYNAEYENGVRAEDRMERGGIPWPSQKLPLFFWASNGLEEISATGTTYINRTEVEKVTEILSCLLENGVSGTDIGIIVPYERQRLYLLQFFKYQGALATSPTNPDWFQAIKIASVESFQGRERKFIIITCVRSNEQEEIGFLRDPKRMNVMLTRSRN